MAVTARCKAMRPPHNCMTSRSLVKYCTLCHQRCELLLSNIAENECSRIVTYAANYSNNPDMLSVDECFRMWQCAQMLSSSMGLLVHEYPNDEPSLWQAMV